MCLFWTKTREDDLRISPKHISVNLAQNKATNMFEALAFAHALHTRLSLQEQTVAGHHPLIQFFLVSVFQYFYTLVTSLRFGGKMSR